MLKVSKLAVRTDKTKGRVYKTNKDNFRNEYQRDVGRIIHSTAFRRLKYKTQVFVNHEGDHYRTRLTHTLEVSQIARSISRYFKLNEDLTEAIALAHDLGHTPFGHAGEDALVKASNSYFNHNDQSFRIITFLEKVYLEFDGLNLTWETLEGIAKHNGPIKKINKKSNIYLFSNEFMDLDLKTFPSLEAQIAAISDDIAYINHDLDDGFRAGLFDLKNLKKYSFYKKIIKNYSVNLNTDRFKKEFVRKLINTMVVDLIKQTEKNLNKLKPKNVNDIRNAGFNIVSFSNKMKKSISEIRFFLNKRMYNHKIIINKTKKYKKLIQDLYKFYITNKINIPTSWIKSTYKDNNVEKKQVVIDYISGMTDRYILKICNKI